MSYIKIIDETKKCEVFLNENPDEEQIADLTEQGFIEGEWERAWDGFPYAKGYAPEKPDEAKRADVRAVRNSYLVKYVDPKQLVLVWNNLSEEERKEYTDYRQYLLDYPETEEDWYERNPKTFEEWKEQEW